MIGRKKLVEGHTKEKKENRARSEELDSHRKSPKKEHRQSQLETADKKPQSSGHPRPLGKLQDDERDRPGQQELDRICATWRIERLSGGGQKREVLDRVTVRGRGRIADTRANEGDKAPQSISGRSAVPGKKEVTGKKNKSTTPPSAH